MPVTFLLQTRLTKNSKVEGIFLSREDLFNQDYFLNVYNGVIKLQYARTKGYFRKVEDMSLQEFEDIFGKDIDKVMYLLKLGTIFSSTIYNKYSKGYLKASA